MRFTLPIRSALPKSAKRSIASPKKDSVSISSWIMFRFHFTFCAGQNILIIAISSKQLHYREPEKGYVCMCVCNVVKKMKKGSQSWHS